MLKGACFMKKKLFISFLVIILFLSSLAAENHYRDQFQELLLMGKKVALFDLLAKWEEETPDDIELYIAYFNYWINLNSQSEPIESKRYDDHIGHYIEINYNEADVKTGMSYIHEAIKLYPDRLDLYLGPCSIYSQMKKYEELYSMISTIYHQSIENNHVWFWTDHTIIENNSINPENVVLERIYGYLGKMYEDIENTQEYIKKIIDLEVDLFPQNVRCLNNASQYYASVNDFDRTLELLFQANYIDPDDYVVVANIAYTYELQGDYSNSLIYYHQLMEFDISEAIEYAENGINRIQN